VLRYTVSEGTWMSLDIAPDGQTIIFDLLGDLYSLPISGGRATRLTSGMAFNRQPRYSPDGRHIVFVSDRSGSSNVWIARADASHPRRLSDLRGYVSSAVTSPVWSPDGGSILVSQMLGATRIGGVAFGQDSRWFLAAYDVATGRMAWISDTLVGRSRSVLGATPDPSGGSAYAAVDAARNEQSWLYAPYWRVMRIGMRTGRIDAEMGARVGRIGIRPALSRNGRYMTYASSSGSGTGLRLRDLRTGVERWLVREALDDPPLDAQGDSRDLLPGYAFAPDSRSVVIAYGGKIHRIDVATGRTRVIPFVADIARDLGPLASYQFDLPDTALRTRSAMHPVISPDGSRAAFSALDRIWVMDLPSQGETTATPVRLTEDSVGEFYPSWSPDGDWIAYSTWDDREGGAVRAAHVPRSNGDVSGPSRRISSDTGMYFQTAVSPDGSRVVAVRASLPPDRVLSMEVVDTAGLELDWFSSRDGTRHTITRLVEERHPPFGARYPVDQVYFTADSTRVYVGLTSWKFDGSDRRSALEISGFQAGSALIERDESATGVLSPDRRRVLVSRRYTLFEALLSATPERGAIALNLTAGQHTILQDSTPQVARWGTALEPWMSWARTADRALFGQGGTLFLGELTSPGHLAFRAIEIPLKIARDVPHGTIVLRGGNAVTMRGREVIKRADVVITDGRIAGVGRAGGVPIPRDACVVPIAGMTILPGYVDVHDHVRLPTGLHPQQCWQCLERLAYGVTSARDPQPVGLAPDVFAYRELERSGVLLAPRIFSTGIAYFGTDPPIATLDDARDAIRPNADYFGSETFKVYRDPATGRRAWQLLVMAAAERHLNLTAHVGSVELAMKVVTDGFSGLEHAPQNRLYSDVVTLIARSGTTHTQTYGVAGAFGGWHFLIERLGDPWQNTRWRRFAGPAARALTCDVCMSDPWFGPPEVRDLIGIVSGAKHLVDAGGRVAIGSHGDIPGLGMHYEMWLHALGGMASHDILRSATIVGATAIGHAKDLGSIEVGKLADLQVLNRSPLKNIRFSTSIRFVMKGGRLYDADDLTELWPVHKPVPPTYLWEASTGAASLRCAPRDTRMGRVEDSTRSFRRAQVR
jgi:Tol biopolymer transport system component